MEDHSYLKQQLMFQGGMTPSQVDQQEYEELLKVLNAKPRSERPMNTGDAHKKLAMLMGGG